MDELQAIDKLGFASARDIQELVDKNIRNTTVQLKKLELYYGANSILFKSFKTRKKIYIKNELFNDICKINRS